MESRLIYEISGTGSPVLFVNAFPFAGDMWSEVASALSDKHKVITMDLPGFGKARGLPPLHSLDECADLIAAILRELDIPRCSLTGCSLGGYILFRFAEKYPGLMNALVLIDTRAGSDAPAALANRHELAAQVRAHGMDPLVSVMLPNFFSAESLDRDPELLTRTGSSMRNTDPEAAAAMLEAMAARPDSTERLPDIPCPACVVVGAEDVLTPKDQALIMHNGLKNSTLQIIPGCGHLPMLERPGQCAQIIREFLESICRKGAMS
jgi:pimeloyl-ACP methyl ester carboxylesterase